MKILKIKTLEKGWVDQDKVMLHANFQILTNFVEQEDPFEIINWNSDKTHKEVAKEIRSLYRWWTKSRPNRRDPFDDLKKNEIPSRKEHSKPVYEDDGKTIKYHLFIGSPPNYPKYNAVCKKSHKLDIKWETEDQENLFRLIKIRRFLWT
jgi:hypothetical protein